MGQYTGNPVKFSAIAKHTRNTSSTQVNTILAVCGATGTFTASNNPKDLTMGMYSTTAGFGYYDTGMSFTSINRVNHTMPQNTEYLLELELRADNKMYGKITRLSDSEVIFEATETIPFSISNYYLALHQYANGTASFREVKVKPL